MDFGLRIEIQLVAGIDWSQTTSASFSIAECSCHGDLTADVVSPSDDVSLLLTAGGTTSPVLFLTPDLLHTVFSLGAQSVTVIFLLQQLFKPPRHGKHFRTVLRKFLPPGCHLLIALDRMNRKNDERNARLFFVSRLDP